MVPDMCEPLRFAYISDAIAPNHNCPLIKYAFLWIEFLMVTLETQNTLKNNDLKNINEDTQQMPR